MTTTSCVGYSVLLQPAPLYGPYRVTAPCTSPEWYGPVDVRRVLLLSDTLVADVEKWDARYQSSFNGGDPGASGFESAAVEAEFIADGRALAVRLAAELPGAQVEYRTDRDVMVPFGEVVGGSAT